MSPLAWAIGAVGLVCFILAAVWPSVAGTLGFAVAGLIAFGLFGFVSEDDRRRS